MATRKRRSTKLTVSKLLPNTRTVRLLQAQGWAAALAETRRGKFTFDWCGFADILAWRPPGAWLIVQCTANGDVWRRVLKIKANAVARAMIYAGERIEVWGWEKHWEEPRVVQMMPCDLGCPVVALAAL